MNVVTISRFRANQSKYLGLAKSGQNVVLTSRLGDFMLVPLGDNSTALPKELPGEWKGALKDARDYMAGDKSKMRPIADLLNEL